MGWLYLSLGIISELSGTTCLKLADGFSRPLPSVLVFVFYAIAFGLMIPAVKLINLSMAYAVWAGVGVAATALIGMIWFNEPASAGRLFFIGIIVAGVVGLRLCD